jgi:hypothetical protein
MSLCPNCGRDQESGVFCDGCGLKIGVAMPAPANADAIPTLHTCPECGIATTEVFCPSCAVRVRPIEREEGREEGRSGTGEPRRCRVCGTCSHAPVCPSCGNRFSV